MINMKFEVSKLGNRICIKTIKDTYCKVTYLDFIQAKKTIQNIKKNGWTMIFNHEVIGIGLI